MSNFELEIELLKKKIEDLEKKNGKKNIYQYSKIRDIDLRELVEIEENLDKDKFDEWFNNNIIINPETNLFLENLIAENEKLMKSYTEEDLKINFIGPLLKKVNFKSFENKFRDFYELQLSYESEDFIFNGTTDFVVSEGLTYSKKPYFFIQEFKKSKTRSDPEPQLLAELITGIELNDWQTIKGAYIVGENWNFVILNKLDKNKYEYFVSPTFNSSKLNDLKKIYTNLVFVKQEIITMINQNK